MKRAMDLALATLGLVVAVPVIAICALVIRWTSPGKAILRQTRVGLDERPFTCLKLRTMYVDTKDAPSHHTGRSAVTPIGHHLRRLKLDELPQLWNILRGEMSFVGPRPCLPMQTELIEARRARGLYRIRPGITGVAQVAGVDMSDPERLAALDATYLDKMSLGTDLRLIMATALGSGRGDRVIS
jgi:O-antigen biosynthesis protein WbqP